MMLYWRGNGKRLLESCAQWYIISRVCNKNPVLGNCYKCGKQLRSTALKPKVSEQIIQWIFTADVNMPNNIKNLGRLLLTPSENLLFLQEWSNRAHCEAGIAWQPADSLYGITAEMLTGIGPYASSDTQVSFAAAFHHLLARLALEAIFAVPAGKKELTFATVCQGVTEPFTGYVGQMWVAIQDSELPAETKEQLFRVMVHDNANNHTKGILATLPQGATVKSMLQHVAQAEQIATTVQVAMATPSPRRGGNEKFTCYRCGLTGHMRRNCTKKVWCHHCQQPS